MALEGQKRTGYTVRQSDVIRGTGAFHRNGAFRFAGRCWTCGRVRRGVQPVPCLACLPPTFIPFTPVSSLYHHNISHSQHHRDIRARQAAFRCRRPEHGVCVCVCVCVGVCGCVRVCVYAYTPALRANLLCRHPSHLHASRPPRETVVDPYFGPQCLQLPSLPPPQPPPEPPTAKPGQPASRRR